MKRIPIAAAVLFGLTVSPAIADVTSADTAVASDSANPTGQALPKNNSAIQASFNSDQKTASITGTFNLNIHSTTPAHDYISVTAQTPFAQGQNYVNTVTLDGLTKATSVTFKYTHVEGGFVPESGEKKMYAQEGQAQCRKLYRSITQAFTGTAQELDEKVTCDKGSYEKLLKRLRAKETTDEGNPQIDSKDFQDEKDRLDKIDDALKAFDAATRPDPASLLIWSVNGGFGYDQHVYYDPTTLVKNTANKTPWHAGAAVSYVPESWDMSLNASFTYQEAFQDSNLGMPQIKCINSGATCVNGFIGAPTLQDKALLGGDFRWTPKFGNIPIGIDPGFTYDALHGAEAVQFPIYLVADADNNLTGGIRYDWTSTTHISTVGVFVSSKFSIFE